MPGVPDRDRPAVTRIANEAAFREMVTCLNELHKDAGIPSARRVATYASMRRGAEPVSYETVAAMLAGRNMPRWPKLQAVVRELAEKSRLKPNVNDTVSRFQTMWLRARGDQGTEPSAPPVLGEVPDDAYVNGDALDLAIAAGGVASMRREIGEIRFALVGPRQVGVLTPDEAEQIALSLILAARRARRATLRSVPDDQ